MVARDAAKRQRVWYRGDASELPEFVADVGPHESLMVPSSNIGKRDEGIGASGALLGLAASLLPSGFSGQGLLWSI